MHYINFYGRLPFSFSFLRITLVQKEKRRKGASLCRPGVGPGTELHFLAPRGRQWPRDRGVAHAAASPRAGILRELLFHQLAGCSSLWREPRALGMGCHQIESPQVPLHPPLPRWFSSSTFFFGVGGAAWTGYSPLTEDVHSPLSRDASAPRRVKARLLVSRSFGYN